MAATRDSHRAAKRSALCRSLRPPRRSARPCLFLEPARLPLSRSASRLRRVRTERRVYHGHAAAIQFDPWPAFGADERLARRLRIDALSKRIIAARGTTSSLQQCRRRDCRAAILWAIRPRRMSRLRSDARPSISCMRLNTCGCPIASFLGGQTFLSKREHENERAIPLLVGADRQSCAKEQGDPGERQTFFQVPG